MSVRKKGASVYLWSETRERNMAKKIQLYEALNEPNIVNYIKVNRLAWAGHLMRMNNDRILNKIFNTKPDGVEQLEDRKYDGKMELIKICEY